MPAPILTPLIALFLLVADPVLAACSDAAAPKVDWRRCLQDGLELGKVDLTGAVLRDASFQRAQLTGARLAGVEAPDARFVSADLAGADLTGAMLRGADFTRGNLRGAVLARADLRRARFFRSDLTEADLSGAQLAGADFSGATLDGALWVDGEKRCAPGSMGRCL